MRQAMHLGAERVIYSFSARHAPALEVPSGAVIAVQTRDAYDGRFGRDRDIQAYLKDPGRGASNPATGPVAVRNVQPGDGLDVRIEEVSLEGTGFVAVLPGIGVLGDLAVPPRLVAFQVRPDGLWTESGLRLPLRPMIGTIGVAPASGEIPTKDLGYHGGNLDCNDIAPGTTIHFPVQVPGGMLALGDVHASMGFGEVFSGVNIGATVTLGVRRVERAPWRRPWFETDKEVMTLGVEDTLEQAIRQATLGMTEVLGERLGVSLAEAIALTGAACDVRLGQASKFGVKVSAYAVFPKSALGGPARSGT